MWIQLAIKWWREIVILLLMAVSSWMYFVSIPMLNDDVLSANQERDKFIQVVEFQNISMANQKIAYEEKLKELPKTLEKIKTEYVPIIERIETFKGDSNASDCENVTAFFSTIVY